MKETSVDKRLNRFGLVVGVGEMPGKLVTIKDNRKTVVIGSDQMDVLQVFALQVHISKTSGVGEAEYSQLYEGQVPGSYRGTRRGFVEDRDVREAIHTIKGASKNVTPRDIADRILMANEHIRSQKGTDVYEDELKKMTRAVQSKWALRVRKSK